MVNVGCWISIANGLAHFRPKVFKIPIRAGQKTTPFVPISIDFGRWWFAYAVLAYIPDNPDHRADAAASPSLQSLSDWVSITPKASRNFLINDGVSGVPVARLKRVPSQQWDSQDLEVTYVCVTRIGLYLHGLCAALPIDRRERIETIPSPHMQRRAPKGDRCDPR